MSAFVPVVDGRGPINMAHALFMTADESQPSSTPTSFLCPISQAIMRDPVIALDGHSYERAHITRWFQAGRNSSPMTNMLLADTRLIPNHTLRNAIADWLRQVILDGATEEQSLTEDEPIGIPAQEDLWDECDKARMAQVDELAVEIGELAQIAASQGKSCFEDEYGSRSFVPLHSLCAFKGWMHRYMARSTVFFEDGSPMFGRAAAQQDAESCGLDEQLFDLPEEMVRNEYMCRLREVLEATGCQVCFRLSKRRETNVTLALQNSNAASGFACRQLPVCIWMSWARVGSPEANGDEFQKSRESVSESAGSEYY
eukprot:6206430-Pleurochrysis_carterae.AAC.2